VTAIKICGITLREDAIFINQCGADALGFIFYPRSPRYIDPEQAKQIIEELSTVTADRTAAGGTLLTSPGRITTVGVFVDGDIEKVQEIASFCGIDLIQLHGNESADYCGRFPAERIIKAFALKTDADLQRIKDYKVRAVLIDAFDPVHYGGTGKTSNWDLAAKAGRTKPLILSGGLHIGNIREALEAVGPDAVDICSGVEISPGVKSHEKIKAIIDLIRGSL
jgi:phosphoribosylanthranilate isomerase